MFLVQESVKCYKVLSVIVELGVGLLWCFLMIILSIMVLCFEIFCVWVEKYATY